jgi:hypothetical protein
MPPQKRRQRGYIEQLPSGNYRAVTYAGTDLLTRRPRYIRETVKTYDAAKKALVKLQHQVDEDKHPKSDITVGQAIEQWLEVAALEDTTRERYADLILLYILPTFGHLQAANLDAELLERFYARLHRCRDMCAGRPRAGHTCRPLSTSTTRKVHYIIRGALERAVRWRHLGVNKAAMAVAPSPERTEPDPPSAAPVLDPVPGDEWEIPARGGSSPSRDLKPWPGRSGTPPPTRTRRPGGRGSRGCRHSSPTDCGRRKSTRSAGSSTASPPNGTRAR